MKIPPTLINGDSYQWDDGAVTLDGTVYASAGYTLTYRLRGPAILNKSASANGTGWRTILTTTDTATLTAGEYLWSADLTATGIKKTIGEGRITVEPNPANLTAGYDPRSPAEKALAACESALATGAIVVRYQVGDRLVQKSGTAEILQAISYWRAVVANERAAISLANGQGDPRRTYVRF